MALPAPAQPADTAFLKSLYDRSINFYEDKLDSILWNARLIETRSEKIGFPQGRILSQRLYGLYHDLSGNYDSAIQYYLKTLEASKEGHFKQYEISALSDLAIAYSEIKQPEKALEVYRECLQLTEDRGEASGMISAYSNIGAIYNMLNEPDSALIYLKKAAELSNQYHHRESLPFINNNTGNVYFKKKEFKKALEFFRLNKGIHEADKSQADLWIDYLNMGDCFIELGKYDSARAYVQESLEIALLLESRSKEADSYALMAKYYERTEQYKKALDFQKKWYQLDTALVNESSGKTIAELQEKFHASDREKQNQLLMAEVGKQKIRNTYLSYLTGGAIVIGLLVAAFLVVYRRANRKLKEVNLVIGKQKEKLALLNQEKNSLISIVSHDLSSPFASIAMWSQLLRKDENLDTDQQMALEKIQDSARNGERLIQRILEIEREGTSIKPLEIEETNLSALIAHVTDQFQPKAAAKQIRLEGPDPQAAIFMLTDQDLVRRIVENLVSNAIKFSPPGKNIWVRLMDEGQQALVEVADQGPGIPAEEQHLLFAKYAQMSGKPTAGEHSTGLGLSIVKRLVNELNGSVTCTSEKGKGTIFRVIFPK